MRLIGLALGWLALIGFAAALGGGALVYYLAARSLPDYEGVWSVSGLRSGVRIVRDAHAVPHIDAQTDADALFALGWVHAEDRLWQMETARRAAQGRLAELFGPEALPLDRSMRALDLDGAAAAAEAALDDATRGLLRAYADGVNARIRAVNDAALGRGAPEFFVFPQDGLAPWTPTDSMSVVKLMALRLTSAAALEARRARLLARLSPEQVADLDPDPPGPALVVPPPAETEAAEPQERADVGGFGPGAWIAAAAAQARPAPSAPSARPPLSPFAPPGRGGASNAWAVDAGRAAAGAPLLAADPHLWLATPTVWHLARISSPGFDVMGGAVAGIPAILIGRNARLGWGLTTAQLDDQDVYLERLDPTDPTRYRTPDGWTDLETRSETIRVKDAAADVAVFSRTRHGPVLPPDGALSFASITPPGHVAAMAWTALQREDASLAAAFALMRAQTVEAGVAAVRGHLAPAQNVVLADAEGVAMTVAGAAPRRRPDSRSRGRAPSLGWVAENDWLGVGPAVPAPTALRPEGGAVLNANNRTTDAAFPDHVTHDWAAPYRARRIAERLNARPFHTRESFAALQSDATSAMARSVLPLIANDLWWGAPPDDVDAASAVATRRDRALSLLADWTGEMSAHDPEPLIFSAWMRALTRRLAEDEIGPLFAEIAGVRPLFVERVFRDVGGASRWCDVVKTTGVETCADAARRALDDALAELVADHGPDLDAWRWGAVHRAVHRHEPLGRFGLLGALVNIEHESAGGDHTVLMGASSGRGPAPYANVHAAGLRMVLDFADLDRSLIVTATGQSGHPLSRHYDDLSALWRRGEAITMSMAVEDALAGARGVTRLTPGQ